MAKVKKAFFCKNCGFEAPKWLGRCPSCGEWNTFTEEIIARESGSVAATVAGLAARGEAPARRRHPRKRTPPHRRGQQRSEPRAGRRDGAGVADPPGRGAGHRQVDPLAADRTGGERAENALCLGRGVGRTDQDACGPPRHRERRMPDLSRDAARKHRQADRRTQARPGGDRLDTDHLYRPAGLVGGKRVADTRMRRDAAQVCQVDRDVDLHHRPHHQGRKHRRAQDPGTHRRRGPAIRRRQQQYLPHPARHKEPFRRDVRNRGIRDAATKACGAWTTRPRSC